MDDPSSLRGKAESRKRRVLDTAERLWTAVFFVVVWAVWPTTPAQADTAQKHLTLDEIIVTEDASTGPMETAVGVKKIEKGKNINIPDVLKSEPDIDIKRRALIGDTADSLAIRGLSGNRILLNIDGRPVNASGVVGGYYIDWGTIPLDNIEKIEIIRGGSSVRYGNNALTPKLTGTYRPTDSDTVTASVYQALRTPGLPETYWWAEGATHGDPVLKPEKNNAAEFVYRHGFADSAFVRLSAYYYRVDDYIMFRFDPSWRGAYNIDQAELYGASLDSKANLTGWLSGNLSLTWQHSRKEGDLFDTAGLSDEIDYLPEWKAAAGLEFKLPYRSVFNVTLRYMGERQTIYAYSSGWPAQQYFKLIELDPYITADIDLKFPLGRHAEISGYVENLFDEEYEEQFGYPMPGIVFGAAVKLYL